MYILKFVLKYNFMREERVVDWNRLSLVVKDMNYLFGMSCVLWDFEF